MSTESLTEEERAWIGPASFDAPVVAKLLRIHDALIQRIALAKEVADNCSGDYMRAILDGEIDRSEHESRRL